MDYLQEDIISHYKNSPSQKVPFSFAFLKGGLLFLPYFLEPGSFKGALIVTLFGNLIKS